MPPQNWANTDGIPGRPETANIFRGFRLFFLPAMMMLRMKDLTYVICLFRFCGCGKRSGGRPAGPLKDSVVFDYLFGSPGEFHESIGLHEMEVPREHESLERLPEIHGKEILRISGEYPFLGGSDL